MRGRPNAPTPETLTLPTMNRADQNTPQALARLFPAAARLSGPAYEPPYGSAVQDAFAWHAPKYLDERVQITDDATLEAASWPGRAVFTVDFLLTLETERGVRRVAVECGGTHTLRDHQRRLRRDAALVASGTVDALYRLRGSDLLDHMDDCLFLVAAWERAAGAGRHVPDLFSERGRINLTTLATPEVKNHLLRPEQAAALVTYVIDPEDEGYFSERHLWHAANGTNPFILLRRFDARFPEAWQAHAETVLPRGTTLRPTGS